MASPIFNDGDRVTLTEEARIRYHYQWGGTVDELVGEIRGGVVSEREQWMYRVHWNRPVNWASLGSASSRHFEKSLRLIGPEDSITAGARAYVNKELDK